MKTFKINVSKYFSEPTKLGEVLHQVTKREFPELADAASKGAVWHQKGGKGKILRIRSLHVQVHPADVITFYYEPRILALPEFKDAKCLFENAQYGVWVKPVGIMPQGTQASDHTSLLRAVERTKKKDVYLIHRLDRETEGLMIIGYTSQAAAKLSELFLKNKISKKYQAIVLGEMEVGKQGTINAPLEGKEAITHYKVLESKNNQSLLEVKIDTGRLHQIRKHLESIGHPIMGDPQYGKGNKNREGLKLLARELGFQDPWDKKEHTFVLESSLTI